MNKQTLNESVIDKECVGGGLKEKDYKYLYHFINRSGIRLGHDVIKFAKKYAKKRGLCREVVFFYLGGCLGWGDAEFKNYL